MEMNPEPTPVLIVAFLRSKNLEQILASIPSDGRKVFIWIDRSSEADIHVNQDVVNTASRFAKTRESVSINWSARSVGVGGGVPAAVNWAFEYVPTLYILEDDCIPLKGSYRYVDSLVTSVTGEVWLIACSRPTGAKGPIIDSTVTSNYPLIWGWATTKSSWAEMCLSNSTNYTAIKFVKILLTNPAMTLPLCFFLAAHIRGSKGKLKAWDGPLAFKMLLERRLCIVPNVNLISNLGGDEYASNTRNMGDSSGTITTSNGLTVVEHKVDYSKKSRKMMNKSIEKNIFHLKRKQFLSPIKAIFR